VATNNFFAPLKDLPMDNAGTGKEETQLKRLKQMIVRES
jgi:hypothetical protein